ncbi:MAG TPA: metallophosphoesterase [Gemmataceae bacterium]
MPAPQRMLTFLRQATALVRAAPGRKGHLLDLPPCTDILVTGDLHGHVGHFQALLQAADLANNPGRHFVMQEAVHGKYRYPNGGDKSHQLVDLFAALKCQYPQRVHYLPGNHELAQWTGRPVIKADEDLNALFEQGVRTAYGSEAGPEVYRSYLELFQALPLAIRVANGVLICHSLPSARALPLFDAARLEREQFDKADLEPGGTVHSLLWGRDTAPGTAAEFLTRMQSKLLVSGHIASDTGYSIPNERQVILDCAESPAGYILFPADKELTHAELVACLRTF